MAHGQPGVAAKVLVGEEEHLLALRQRPLEDGPGVGGRADGTALAADERLEVGRAVHVGDGYDLLDVDDRLECLPGLLDRVDVGHVGHRAAGVEVGEDDLLVGRGEHVGRLGHEVHAAEDDEVGLGPLLGEDGEAVRVAPSVGPAHDLVPLVVVAEDEQPLAEGGLGRLDHASELVGRRVGVALGQSRLDAQHVGWGLPLQGTPMWTVRTAGSPCTGMSSSEWICGLVPGRRAPSLNR
jgi:hypothetical protein